MQVAPLTSSTPAAQPGAAEETGSRAEQFARVLKNAFFGNGSKAVAHNAERAGPEPAQRSETRSHEMRGNEARATERREQRASDYRDSTEQSAVRKTQPEQQTSHRISSKPAETAVQSDSARQAEQAPAPQSEDTPTDTAAETAPAEQTADAPTEAAEDADAPATDAPAADALVTDAPTSDVAASDLLLILSLLQNQGQGTKAGSEPAAAGEQAGQTAGQTAQAGLPVAGAETLRPETVPAAAADAEIAVPAPAVPAAPAAAAAVKTEATPPVAAPVIPAVAEVAPVLPENAAALGKATETSAAALLAQQEAVTPEDFAAIQQALMSQGQAKPATDAAVKSVVPDAVPAATEGKANNAKGLVVEVQTAPPSNAAARMLVDQSALLAMQTEAATPQDAALQQLQAQPQPSADAKFAAVLQAQAELAAPQANAAAGTPNTPAHISQQASPLANPGTPAPQAAQQAASHAAARQLGAYIPAGEQVAVQIRKGVAEGIDKISIRLDPGNLGKVDIKMEVGHDGRLTAVIAADKPETLAMLQRDMQTLEQSLRDAGLKTSSDSLSFTLRDQNQASDGRDGRDGQAGGGRNNGRGHDEYAGTGATTDPAALAAANAQRAATARGGLDIRI